LGTGGVPSAVASPMCAIAFQDRFLCHVFEDDRPVFLRRFCPDVHCSFYLAVALYGCFRPPITISPPLEEPSPRCQCPSGRAAEWGTSGWPLPPPRSARVFVCALLCVVCCLLDCLCPLGSPTALVCCVAVYSRCPLFHSRHLIAFSFRLPSPLCPGRRSSAA